MSLKERMDHELTAASQVFKDGGTLPRLTIEIESKELRVDLTAVDRLACAFTSFSLTTANLDDGYPTRKPRPRSVDLSRGTPPGLRVGRP